MIMSNAMKTTTVQEDPLRKRSTIDRKPREERSNLVRCEDVHLKHRDRMWAHGSVEQLVDTELNNC